MAATAARAFAPIPIAQRISSLDVLRGFALLGILLMNVQSFSMPIAAYFNPTVYGDFSGANLVTWFLVHLFIDQKFMTLFSILFGAGIVLLTSKAEQTRGSSAGPHYRRMLWLLLFGAAHAYLLWYGDVLYTYAVAAVLLYPLRKAAPRKLLVGGLIVFGVTTLIGLAVAAAHPQLPPEATERLRADWSPSPDHVAAEVAAYQGGWVEQSAHRVPMALYVETEVLVFFWGWKAAGLILIGMALFKWGVLSAERSNRTYRRLATAGFGLGFPLVLTGVALNVSADWSFERSLWSSHFNYWGSLLVAIGYIGLVMLAVRSRILAGFQSRLAAVGRTAFTNYLLQTILCTTLFYGHGFGLFGQVDRAGQVAVVLAVWSIQLAASPWWLRRFSLGPFEWVWRTLTYLRLQPLRAPPLASTAVPAARRE